MQRPAGQRCLLAIGSIGPLGYAPASGTVSVALVGVPLFGWMHALPLVARFVVVAVLTLGAVALHQWGDRVLGEKDSRKLVWDEIVGFLIAVTAVPFTWQLAAAAFVVERGLDILKFPPAGWVERHGPGGWGVVGDDVVAGLYTCGALHLLMRAWPSAVGLAA